MAVLIFPACKVHWTQLYFLCCVLCSLHDNFIFSLRDIWNINKPILKYACYYVLSERKTRMIFHERHTNTNVAGFWGLSACAKSPHPGSDSLLWAIWMCHWHSKKSDHRRIFLPPTPGARRIWHIHCQLCTCNTLTCIPMIPSVLSPISPCIALTSDSTEHRHQAHFSPNSADNAGEPPRSYLSSVCSSQRIL